jgi:cell division protein FtsZ
VISGIASRIGKASFVAANTNFKSLKEINRNVAPFLFGEAVTHGLGTGMNPELGQTAALTDKDKIKKMCEGQDLCVIVACLGGGTGSGAAPVIAKIAKNMGCLTYGIFTLPFNFEGEKKATIAREALDELKPKLHALSVIPNERIFQIIQKETPLRQALSAINDRLASALEGLVEIIFEPGLINIDFADFRTIFDGQGRLTYLNTVEVPRKEGAAEQAIEKLLNSPLYSYGIKGAKGVLYNIGGEKGLTLNEVNQISKTNSNLVNKEAKIVFGISQNQKYGDVVKTTLLATGCGTKIFFGKDSEKKEKKNDKKTKKRRAKIREEKKSKPDKEKNFSKKSKPTLKKKKQGKQKKIKIKVVNESTQTDVENRTNSTGEFVESPQNKGEIKTEARIRKNALQLKKEAEQEEAEMLAKEKAWETPAFLRRKKVI